MKKLTVHSIAIVNFKIHIFTGYIFIGRGCFYMDERCHNDFIQSSSHDSGSGKLYYSRHSCFA